MFTRSITVDQVKGVIEEGQIIAKYPDDRPYPSELRLGFAGGDAIHVVFAYNVEAQTGYVVTAYLPDPKLWSDNFTARRSE